MDIIDSIKNRYLSIPLVYRRTFWIVFLLTSLVYSFQAYNYLIGYHSYILSERVVAPMNSIGRFSAHWFAYPTYGKLLPVAHTLFCVLLMAAGAILTAKLWDVPKRTTYYVLFSLSLTCLPHSILWIYFSFAGNYAAVPLYAVALLLTQRYTFLRFCCAAALVAIGLGIYQASIMALGILFLGMLIRDIIAYRTEKWTEFRNKYIFAIVAIICGGIGYAVMYKAIDLTRGVVSNYMTETMTLTEFLHNIPVSLEIAFSRFVTPSLYLGWDHAITVLIIAILALVTIFMSLCQEKQKKGMKFTVVSILLLLLVASSAFVSMMSQHSSPHWDRINYYGYVYVILFLVACVLGSKSKVVNNLGVLTLIAFIFISTSNNLWFQRNWKRASDFDTRLVERVIERVEAHEQFQQEKSYSLCCMGSSPSVMAQLVKFPQNEVDKARPFLSPIIPHFAPIHMFNYVNPFLRLDEKLTSRLSNQNTREKVEACLLNMKPWPHHSSVQLCEDIILVGWTQSGIDKQRELIKSLRN